MSLPDPKTYFTELFPAQWARTLGDQEREVTSAQRLLDDMRGVNATLAVEVRGGEGGRYLLNIRDGVMEPGEDGDHSPFLTLVLDPPDFGRLVEEAGDSPLTFLGALAGQGGDLKITATRMQNLNLLEGTLRFELTGDDGFAILAHFSDGPVPEEPTCTIRAPRDAYALMKRGELAAQDAFLAGQIQLEGDMQLAMQLALAVLSPE